MNKKPAFTMCTTERKGKKNNLFVKTGYSVYYDEKRAAVVMLEKVQKIPADISRSEEDAAVTDSAAAAYNRDTRRHRCLRPRRFDQTVHRNRSIYSVTDASRFLTREKRYSCLCWMRCGRRERESLNAKALIENTNALLHSLPLSLCHIYI